jgi:hypothetical protein
MIYLLQSSGKLIESHTDYGCVEMRVELVSQGVYVGAYMSKAKMGG